MAGGLFARVALGLRVFWCIVCGRALSGAMAVRIGLGPAGRSPADAAPAATPGPHAAGSPAAQRADATPAPGADAAAGPIDGAVALLAALQRAGRLVDFLAEPIDGFSDAEVGAAARAVHRGCRAALEARVQLAPIVPADEGAIFEVPAGFDPDAIQLRGAPSGEPPFRGVVAHPGRRAILVDLGPVKPGARVVTPAEVEVT